MNPFGRSPLFGLLGIVYFRKYPTKRNICIPSCNQDVILHPNFSFRSFNLYAARFQHFNVMDYDCIGFDLDNTLCEYKLKPLIELGYSIMAKYLCEVKNYNPQYLLKPLTDADFDFMQRGLILDLKRGNVLKVNSSGKIIKASHGTNEMDESGISDVYGPDRKWSLSDQLCSDLISTWNGPPAEEIRTILDCFDLPASLLFARGVDSIDHNGKVPINYVIGKHIVEALVFMYTEDKSRQFFKTLEENPKDYLNELDNSVKDWLRKVKRSKTMFLLSGSDAKFVSWISSYCIGEDWREFFDVIVCFARKPGFFTKRNKFFSIDSELNEKEIKADEIEKGMILSQGNWKDLNSFLTEISGVETPKYLYIGDNLVQDVYTPAKYASIDTVAVLQELYSGKTEETQESDLCHPFTSHSSRRWGSFFCDASNEDTLWGGVLKDYSVASFSSLRCLSKESFIQL